MRFKHFQTFLFVLFFLDLRITDNGSSSSDNNSQEAKPKRKIDYAKNFPLEEEKGLPAFVKVIFIYIYIFYLKLGGVY